MSVPMENKVIEPKELWNTKENFFLPGGVSCPGCGSMLASRLVMKTLYDEDKNVMVFGRSCGGGRSELQTGGRIGLDGSGMAGIELGMKLRNINDKNLVVMSGDGRALDMGFGDFSASFDREQQITWVILDNQAFASSGSHASLTTPLKSQTRLYTHGKPYAERNVPLMMIMNKAKYVATASPAFVGDLVSKIRKAVKNKPSYVHIYCPCVVSWKIKPHNTVKIAKKAVTTGLYPLWEYEEGTFARTVLITEQEPIEEYFALQKRYSGLKDESIEEIREYVKSINQVIEQMEKAFKK